MRYSPWGGKESDTVEQLNNNNIPCSLQSFEQKTLKIIRYLDPFTFHFHALEKEMATHSRVLAWRIPGTGEPGGLPSVGSHRVRHDWSNLAAAALRSL